MAHLKIGGLYVIPLVVQGGFLRHVNTWAGRLSFCVSGRELQLSTRAC